MILFLIGSVFAGRSNTMTQLILARGLQGIGAGGVLPLAFILIGEMFTLEQRARMQGFFSGVWGVSSIIGPLLGGFLVDQLSWRWVFYINILPGLLGATLVALAWRDQPQHHERPAIDYAGAILLTMTVVTLLLGLVEFGTSTSWLLIAVSVLLFAALLWVESRAADPILPLHLFREKLFGISVIHGTLTGWAMFGSISFVPLFVQSVLGTSATQAGITIAPMLLGWVMASIIGTRLLLTVGYRKLAILGTSSLVIGSFLMSRADANINQYVLMAFVTLMGIGMGFSIPPFLIAVQTTVERRYLGTATSTLQFSRSIGGTLGVSVMGAALSARLISNLSASGMDLSIVDKLLDPVLNTGTIDESLRFAVANAINLVFVIAFVAALLAVIVTFFTPRKELADKAVETEAVIVSAD
jgi:EmrB/QacA subfamily drug resistance transporter